MKLLAVACAVLALGVAGAARAGGRADVRGSIQVNPLSVVTVVSDTSVRRGDPFVVLAIVTNLGAMRLDNVSVTLVRDPAVRTLPGATQGLGRMPARSTQVALWLACAYAAGDFVLLSRARAGTFTTQSPGRLVDVSTSRRPC